jgi:nitrite reductase/ring-hydroxylating ferredoxin subunit
MEAAAAVAEAAAIRGTGRVDAGGFEETIKEDDLQPGGHKLVRLLSGRGVLLVSHSGIVWATDHACYHHGGPLATGDIG